MFKKFRKNLLQIVLIIFLLYFFVLVFLYFYQRNLIYHPTENNYLNDKIDFDYKEIFIETDENIELKSWFIEKDLKKFKKIVSGRRPGSGQLPS